MIINFDKLKTELFKGNDIEVTADGTPTKSKLKIFSSIFDTYKNQYSNRMQYMPGDDALYQASIFSARQVLPNLIANELVGIQPISGPIGQIHTLRTIQSIPTDIMFYPPNNINVGDDELPPAPIIDHKLYGMSVPKFNFGSLSIQVLCEIVQTSVKKRIYTQLQDISNNCYELLNTISNNIIYDTNETLLSKLRNIGSNNKKLFDLALVRTASAGVSLLDNSTFEFKLRYILCCAIRRECNSIAAKTRRGRGNKVVLNRLSWEILKDYTKVTKYVAYEDDKVCYVGKIDNNIDLYLDPFASDITPILILYKGSGEMDSCGIYSPYIPVMINQYNDFATQTKNVEVSMIDEILTISNSANCISNAESYVSLIEISQDVIDIYSNMK